jgi:AcrR family transcriptional regulator
MPASARRGRPPEDRIARRQQIFRAVGPLIGADGVAGFSMERAAVTAGSSIGGLYHYFPNKTALLLYGLAAENLQRVCADFVRGHAALAASDPPALVSAALTELVSAGQTYLRPSWAAARELEPPSAALQLDRAVAVLAGQLAHLVATAHPLLTPGSVDRLEIAVRRAWARGLADEDVTPLQLRATLRAIIMRAVEAPLGVVVTAEPASSPVAGDVVPAQRTMESALAAGAW